MSNQLQRKLLVVMLTVMLVFTSAPMSFATSVAVPEAEPTVAETANQAQAAAKTKLEITKQPAAVKVKGGTNAVVSVAAKGDGLTYSWYYKNKGKQKFTLGKIKGAKYSVKMNSNINGRQVYCVVKDKYGNKVKSKTVTLSMKKTITITKQPKSVTFKKGSTAKVSVAAKGQGLTYSWYYKNKGKKKWNLGKVKGSTYSVTMNGNVAGRKVYCVIKDKYGYKIQTNTVTLNQGTTFKVTKQPKGVTVKNGNMAKTTVTAAGDGLTYKWYYKNKGASKFTLAQKQKTKTYSVKMNANMNGRQVYCVIKDKYGSKITTKTVTLKMQEPLKITKALANVAVKNGETAKVTVNATGKKLTYKWYYKDKGASKFTLAKKQTAKTYSVKMTSKINGRQVYCQITDAYGKKLKTKTVTLSVKKAFKISKQPVSVFVKNGAKATVKVTVTGKEPFKYKWYYKNENESKFAVASGFTTNTYSVKMNDAADCRQLYCVITDAYGDKYTTNTVTIGLNHTWDSGKITKEPTCTEPGEKLLTCTDCKKQHTETVKALGHNLGKATVIRKATANEEGVKRSTCTRCSYYKDSPIPALNAAYIITVHVSDDKSYEYKVAEDGKYTLTDPKRDVLKFEGWKDADGNDFSASGTIKENKEIYAVWKGDEITTLADLVSAAGTGVDEIIIAGDITIDQPVYVPYKTTIYANGDYKLTRAKGYKGDLFVVGQNKKGVASVNMKKKAELTLGGGDGTLTIDGNRGNTTVNVVGSAIFVTDSSVVNIYDGVKIINHKKTGNDRMMAYTHHTSEYACERAGGAAILINVSTVNMYGGLIDNNEVAVEYTTRVNAETGLEEQLEIAGCGGAVFNRGNFNMYGGAISNNDALRGGGVYNDRVAYLVGGEISSNVSTTYGGGISSSSGSNADLFIGDEKDGRTMTIKDNHSGRAGGGVYSAISSPIIVEGNTEFVNNVSDTSGGAIYTAGGLTINDTVFTDNSSTSGGAIYYVYNNASKTPRLMDMTNCVLEGNSAGYGGAVTLSGSDAVAETNKGANATFTNCEFKENKAVKNSNPGNGGALYITRYSIADITGCNFENNTAAVNAGAVAVHSNAQVTVTDSDFTGNTAVYGGGMLTSSNADVSLKNVTFTGNSAVLNESGAGGNAGALSITGLTADIENVDFYNNSAAGNGGAILQNDEQLNLDSTCEFDGNTAEGHGGSVYLTYTTLEDGTKKGAVLNANGVTFKNGSALAGGAVSARTATTANFTDCKLINNAATGKKLDPQGGGAVYAGYATVTMKGVTAEGNSSAGYSGVLNPLHSKADLENCNFNNNTAVQGGAVYINKDMDISLNDIVFSGNKAVLNESGTGGNGGALYVDKTVVEMNNLDFYNNSAATNAGAIYQCGNELNLNSENEFDGNTAGNHGGSVYLVYITNEDKTKTGGVLNADGVTFKNGSALAGGAISARTACEVNLTNSKLIDNEATGLAKDPEGGGALYIGYGSVNLTDVTATGNKSAGFGGAMNVLGAPAVITGSTFENNSAPSGGAVYAMSGTTITADGTVFNGNSSTNENTGYDKNVGGGAIGIVGGSLDLTSVIMDGNTSACYGGAVLTNKTKVNIKENTEVKNSSGATGAALYFANSSTVDMKDTAVTSNKGLLNGIIYLNGGTHTLSNVTATGNSGVSGGVMYVSGGSTNVTVKDCKWNNNYANNGGAIYAKDSANVNVTNVEFKENSGNNGGALALYTLANVELNNVDFLQNTAKTNGGAVYLNATPLDVDATCNFDGNTAASHGGAFYLTYSTDETTGEKTGAVLNATDLVVQNGTALAGGAISVRTDCEVNLNGGELLNNTATGTTGNQDGGGAIYVGTGKATLTGVTANGNKCAGFGGVIYGATTDMTVTDCLFSGNDAATGGVIYGKAESVIDITDNEFTENTGGNGAAVYSSNSDVTLQELTFTGNAATGNGGAVYLNNVALTADNLDFINNSAAVNAGAIYLQGTNMDVDSTFTFEGNKADGHGGIFYVNYRTDSDGTKIGSVLNVKDITLENSSALAGGAISVRSASEANLTNVQLLNNTATGLKNDPEGGGALYVGFGKATLTDVTATGNTSAGYGGVLNGVQATVDITNCDFENNSAPAGGAINAINKSKITVNGSDFVTNKSTHVQSGTYDNSLGGGAIAVNTGSLDLTSVTMDGNTSEYYGGTVLAHGTTVNITENTTVKNSSGATGGALFFGSGSNVTIENSAVNNNTSNANGVVYVNGSTMTMNNVEATGNEGLNGGVLFTSGGNSTKVTVEDCEWNKNSATNGGIINAQSHSNVEFNEVVLTENTATNGGAIYSENGNVTVNDSQITNNEATGTGGAVHMNNGKDSDKKDSEVQSTANVNLNRVVLTGNSAAGNGGAIYERLGNINVVGSVIKSNTTSSHGGAISLNGGNVTVTDLPNTDESDAVVTEISENVAANHGGAVYVSYFTKADGSKMAGKLTMTGGVMQDNEAFAGGAISVRSESDATLTGTQLLNNTITSTGNDQQGGGALYVGYGSATLTDVTATGNESAGYGGVLNAAGATVNVSGGIFEDNSAPNGGAFNAISGSKITVENAEIKGNKSTAVQGETNDSKLGGGAFNTNGGTLNITSSVIDGNTTTYYGAAILSNGTTVNVADTTISNHEGTTGGAMYFSSSAKVTMDNVTATGNKAANGGVLYASGGGTSITVNGGNYNNNSATYGAVLNINGSTANVNGVVMTENTATVGGAVFNKLGNVTITDSEYTNNNATNNGGAVSMQGGTVTAAGENIFSGNTATNHGGAVYVSYFTNETDQSRTIGKFVMNGGKFENNAATSGGAISNRTGCELELTGTELTGNIASSKDTETPAGGGAIYSNDNTVVLSGVVMDGNETGYYGGAMTAQNANVTIKDNSEIKNNAGITGVALQFRGSGTYTVENSSITNNKAIANGSGVVYITSSGTLNMTGVTATGNENNNGGVVYCSTSAKLNVADSSFNKNTAKGNGGAIDFRSSGAAVVTGTTISENTAKQGGAVYSSGSGKFEIKSSTINSNTASANGGAIFATGSGNVTISDGTVLKGNSAPTGGAIYEDAGATITVDKSTLEGNSATSGNGGAILIADSSDEGTAATKLVLNGATLNGNTASAKGGAVSTDTLSPNLIIEATDTVFSGNKSTTNSGGAVEIQNSNCNNTTEPTKVSMVFKNCTFKGNKAEATDGGAVTIRTGSCAKFDGITASDNTSARKGGTIYLTSQYSRVYVTGAVLESGDTTNAGSFIYMYNPTSYTTQPPRLYTTASSDADWISHVIGEPNCTCDIRFDLTELP